MYHNDPGLAYLKKINFQRIKGKWGLLDRWKRDFGSQRGEQIWKEYNDLVNKNKAGEPDFYKFKSSHPLISKGLIEWYDADIIRKACNYIDSHKELFGKNILEVGCDNGNITGFLAITFPESKIVAIDRCEEAVAIAQEKMAALGINNVEFRACDVFDVEEKFDTVLAMRTLHENMNDDIIPFSGDPIDKQISCYALAFEKYIEQLKKCSKVNSQICFIQSFNDHNGLDRLGLSLLFVEKNMQYEETSHQLLVCKDDYVNDVLLDAFACKHIEHSDPETFQKEYRNWRSGYDIHDNNEHKLFDIEALIYLKENAGEMIGGIHVVDPDGYIVGRFIAFKDKDNENLLYYLYSNNVQTVLQGVNADTGLDSILTHINETARLHRNKGFKIVDINPQEDIIEGSPDL